MLLSQSKGKVEAALQRRGRIERVMAPVQEDEAFMVTDTVRIADFPQLRFLAWQRHGERIDARDALALYEANWRFIDQELLTKAELALVERLRDTYGGGVLNV